MGNCREPGRETEQQLGAAAEAGEVEGLLGGGQVNVRCGLGASSDGIDGIYKKCGYPFLWYR